MAPEQNLWKLESSRLLALESSCQELWRTCKFYCFFDPGRSRVRTIQKCVGLWNKLTKLCTKFIVHVLTRSFIILINICNTYSSVPLSLNSLNFILCWFQINSWFRKLNSWNFTFQKLQNLVENPGIRGNPWRRQLTGLVGTQIVANHRTVHYNFGLRNYSVLIATSFMSSFFLLWVTFLIRLTNN